MFAIWLRIWRFRLEAVRRYWTSPVFALIDLCFGCIALFSNPYRVCRKFLQRRGSADIYAYGETPLSTMEKIASICEIGPLDSFVELGAGRGKSCFWMAHFVGCKVHGIEWIPQFVLSGKILARVFGMGNLSFSQEDMEKADLSRFNVVYLYGTCLEDRAIDRLTEKLLTLQKGARVITISYPLEHDGFARVRSFPVRFPWGVAKAYCQVRK